ncbi:MAG: hypothetical protein AB7S26_18715 [Sandaracinaceae bacterium]
MTVRDLGYRAYEGELLPASHNTWVMVRHGLFRIWGSWVNKLVLFFFWVPFLLFALLAFVRWGAGGWGPQEIPEEASDFGRWFMGEPQVWLRTLTGTQFWFFATLVTLRSGAGVISEDLNNKAYQFYFAKPVTPIQYLAGRAGALAIFVYIVLFVPVALMIALLIGLSPEELRLERAGLFLPAILDTAIVALVLSVLSVATSAVSKSRALTLTAWVLALVVPFALALLVEKIGDVEWAHVVSVPGLLWALGDGIYRVESNWSELHWYYAAALLAAITFAAGYSAYYRIARAEVIT